jgi:flagellar biosynthetic protein FlhB
MSEDDKSQPATAKRRADALKEGNVWAPKELAPAVAVMTAAGLAAAMGERLWWGLAGFLAEALAGAGSVVARGEDGMPAGWLAALTPWQGPVVLALAVMVLTGGLAQAATRHVSLSLLAPKLSRLSPIKGVQRIFSKTGLAGAATALLKLGLIGGVAAAVLMPLVDGLAEAGEGSGGLALVGGAVVRLLVALALVMLVVALVDGAISWTLREQKLKMSLQEVKRENRQDNGAPEIKAAIRRAQYAASKRRLQTVLADASVVVVNPTHFAVALRYRPGEDAAPIVVEQGREEAAQAMIEVARTLKLPVVRSPRLARALFFTARPGVPVREELYGAVATILAFIMSLGDPDAPPAVSVPPEFDLDEAGARRKPGAALPL